MALIKYSALVSDMRNKLNGSVASKNRAGNYLRNKTTPVNPQTALQQNVRGLFGNLSSTWRGLSESQRKAWAAAAPDFPYTNIFGDIKILSGFGLFMKLNQNLITNALTTIQDPPAPVAIPAINITTWEPSITEGLVIGMDLVTAPPGFLPVVYATPNVTPGKTFVKNEYRSLGGQTLASSKIEIDVPWVAKFGVPVVGQKIAVRVALLSQASGQMGTPVEAIAVVEA